MIEDVYEPLARYRDEFKTTFARLTREKFRALTRASGIDVAANRRIVAQLRLQQRKAAHAGQMASFLYFLCFLGLLTALACWALPRYLPGVVQLPPEAWWAGLAIGAIGFVAALIFGMRKSKESAECQAEAEKLEARAWEQMRPLNALYTWDITPKLIEATVPRLAFDPYFSTARLAELRRRYGWGDDFNEGKSMIFAQSGTINGNAFVFAQYREMAWDTKTYSGSLEISWTELERDSEGKLQRVRHSEMLTAEVEKPIPTYPERKVLIYGNVAAPNLVFSREPSGLVAQGGGVGNALKKWWRLRKLKKFSRILDDDSNFTLMGNHEFETWFHAKDRNDEVEFRALFTPVAQQQELALMQDQTVGYGDDFTFIKQKCINMLLSRHLDVAPIDTDPARFHSYSYDEAQVKFQTFNERYFKDAYFALAPLLAIPLYQQMRSQEDFWKGVLPPRSAAFWEHEAIANFHGEDKFQHAACVTHSILKTDVVARENGESTVAVTAHGYRGVERTDYVEVHGGDGRWHDVPVHWTEYLPVARTSKLRVAEALGNDEGTEARGAEMAGAIYRRSITSYILGDD